MAELRWVVCVLLVGCGSSVSAGATLPQDASEGDGGGIGVGEAGNDAGAPDTSQDDAGLDASPDTGVDAGTLTGTGKPCVGDSDLACQSNGNLQMCRNGFCVAERCIGNLPGDDPVAHCRDITHGECVHDTSSVQMSDTLVCEVRR